MLRGHLRRHRRPGAPQDPAGPLQPARAGLLPPEQTVVAFARRPYTDDAYRTEMRRVGGRVLARAGGAGAVGRLRQRHPLPAGDFADQAAYAALGARLEQLDAAARHPWQSPVLPGHARPAPTATSSPTWARAGLARPGRGAGSASSSRSPSGTTWPRRGTLNDEVMPRLRRGAGLPHRPLPGQGDRPQPARLPLRQRHLRAALEPPLRRPRADHRGRGPRRRGPRRSSTRRPAPVATSSRTTSCSC